MDERIYRNKYIYTNMHVIELNVGLTADSTMTMTTTTTTHDEAMAISI